jgi:transcriptional regulator with GAF, ATPase, and Fis domain
MIEELSPHLSSETLSLYYLRADDTLSENFAGRLRRAAHYMIGRLSNEHQETHPQDQITDFNVRRVTYAKEAELIRNALIQSKGSLTSAARMLGLTHQFLAHLLNTRHNDLKVLRTPPKQRRKRKN